MFRNTTLCVQDPDADALNSLASAVGGFFTGKITGLPKEKVLSKFNVSFLEGSTVK